MSLVVGLGEVLWDVLPQGRTLGGAPANFAFHANGLGGFGAVVSRVGDDELGAEALALLGGRGVDTSQVSIDPNHPTGTVQAELDAQGRASYVFPPHVAWDFLELDEPMRALAEETDGVCFGTLAQREAMSRAAIHEFLRATRQEALRVFDINLRGDFYTRETVRESLQLAGVLKLSDEELPVVADMFGLSGSEEELLAALVDSFGLALAACTFGQAGSLLLTPRDSHRHPGVAVQVEDTIGAGDAFTAALTLGMLAGLPLPELNERANLVAAAVCGQAGGMPDLPKDLRVF